MLRLFWRPISSAAAASATTAVVPAAATAASPATAVVVSSAAGTGRTSSSSTWNLLHVKTSLNRPLSRGLRSGRRWNDDMTMAAVSSNSNSSNMAEDAESPVPLPVQSGEPRLRWMDSEGHRDEVEAEKDLSKF